MKKINVKSIRYIVWMMVALFLNIATVFGQNNLYTTKIKDGSVAQSEVTAAPATLLELESSTKGFLLPRMTTIQRNAISITDVVRGNGLVIYNTDTDCINYYSREGNRWLSLCGTLPPAILDLTECSKINLSASGNDYLEQGKFLKDTDILYVQLNVQEAGSYHITATPNPENGYSFSKSGTFNAPGVYIVALEGLGTPLVGNEIQGDLLKFSINGKESTACTTTRIKVKPSDLNFSINEPQNVTASWNAYIGVPLNANDNKVTLDVHVTTVGFWRVQTNTVNGMSFSGSGEFTAEGGQRIEVVGQGTPSVSTPVSTPNVFTFTTNSVLNANPTNAKLSVHVKPVAFELVCDDANNKIEIRGNYQEDTKLSQVNSILIPVKVLAPGTTSIELKGTFVGGSTTMPISFKANDVNLAFNASRNNIQFVTLYPDEIMIPKGTTAIKFTTLTPGTAAICATFPEITVDVQPIRYSILCNTVKVHGTYTVDSNLGANHYMELQVNVDYPGPYTIRTNELNGVSFSASGTFAGQGRETIRLAPSGKYVDGGNLAYAITTNSQAGTTTCSAMVDVRFRDIVVLRLGSNAYGPSTSNTYAGGAILNSRVNFGPTGKVKINNIRIVNTAVQGESLRNFISSNKVDIIVNVIGYNATDATNQVLLKFVREEKGVLIISDENSVHTTTKSFIESLTSSSIAYNNHYTMLNPVASGANNDPIVNGPFGNLSGKYIGNDATNGWYYSNLPNTLVPLVTKQNDASSVWGLKHNDLGFAFFGDGGWFIGTTTNTSNTIYPAKFLANGTPVAKPYYQGTDVYNSVLYANVMAWAIEYVKENKPSN
ncbi:hypothetical protein [Myroides fluvii]|uniref:hypothetical protein n=1 Tax=Myroides fluvii TaxID=2572594 RepID=UPI00131C38CB|nr:hypothetical protein [Myroides fluvii]